MTPIREQFKEFIAAVKKAQQKEVFLHLAILGCRIQGFQHHVWLRRGSMW